MSSSSVSITFVKEGEEEEEEMLSLGLDADANEDKTTFAVNEEAYLKFLSSSDEPYIIEVSTGSARTAVANVHYLIEDDKVLFANTDKGYLGYVPSGGVTYNWIGKSGGTPLFAGKRVTLSKFVTAVLNCNYKTAGDRLSVRSSTAGIVLVVVIQGEKQASLSVTFEDDEDEEPEPVSYELEVRDYCADGLLSGVTVYLDGVNIGQTNANGIVALGALTPGSSHTLKMVKSGYINSEDDKLNNDSFTVPS